MLPRAIAIVIGLIIAACAAIQPADGNEFLERIDKARRSHWAFQPIRRPTLPKVGNPGWVRTPIDHFILASLETAGLTPSPPADRL